MSGIQPISPTRPAQLPSLASLCTWKMSGRILRASLPFLSAIGYVASLVTLTIRVAHGDEYEKGGISNQAVKYSLIAAATPLTIATTITGIDAVKQLCTSGYGEAKRIVMESVKPGGFIRNVLLPEKEMIIMGEGLEKYEYAQARFMGF